MTSAIILAAGYSSRAQGFKMEFLIQGKPVLQYVIEAFYPVCDRIYVVSGFQKERLIPLVDPYIDKVSIVWNSHFEDGMFSSVQTGIEQICEERFFLTPGDYPLISSEICRKMLEQSQDFVIPSYQHHGGHPILLPFYAKKEILSMKKGDNLKMYLKQKNVFYLNIEDKGILKDLDTRADYEELCRIKSQKK